MRDEAAGELRFAVDGAAVGDPVPYADAPTGGGRGMLYLGSDVPAYPGYELDEVCIFDTVLDAKALAALGTRADCAAVLDAEPPDTEDAGEPPDTDEAPDTEDTGDTGPAETDTDDTNTPINNTGADTAGSGAAKACGCGPGVGGTGGAAVWALALLAAARRRSA